MRIWIDARPMVYGIDRNSPLVLATYAHEIFGELAKAGFTVQRRGQLDDYKLPPGAPPGWPFLQVTGPERVSSATHSMCGVCGNMSTGRTRRRR